MVTNKITNIKESMFSVPVIIRTDLAGWVPSFEMWETKITSDTSCIEHTQIFGKKYRNYSWDGKNPLIGYYGEDNHLYIHWKTLVDSEKIEVIHQSFNGILRAVTWPERYCTYFNKSSEEPWLHSIIVGNSTPGMVVHHINSVSIDNRMSNLHILPEREHDSIGNAEKEEKIKMFSNPKNYWEERKKLAIESFIHELTLYVLDSSKIYFMGNFIKENLPLAKEILETVRLYINLSQVKYVPSENRKLNKHLDKDYMDTYEIEKFLKANLPKTKKRSTEQFKLF